MIDQKTWYLTVGTKIRSRINGKVAEIIEVIQKDSSMLIGFVRLRNAAGGHIFTHHLFDWVSTYRNDFDPVGDDLQFSSAPVRILMRDAEWVDKDEKSALTGLSRDPSIEISKFRSSTRRGELVIGRYSVLPYYAEVEDEIKSLGGYLINSQSQHEYVADCVAYSTDLKGLTPECFTTWHNLPENAYIIKGKTNSRKMQWDKMMFCPNVASIKTVANRLLDDTFIRDQGLVVRPYIPLEKLGEGINGLPISNEWRFFFLGNSIVECGFYWAGMLDVEPESIPSDAVLFAKKVARIVSEKCNFFVVDIAKTASGEWICIELNDGQMSGLSCIPPDDFYKSLIRNLRGPSKTALLSVQCS